MVIRPVLQDAMYLRVRVNNESSVVSYQWSVGAVSLTRPDPNCPDASQGLVVGAVSLTRPDPICPDV